MPSSAIESVPFLIEFIRKNNPHLSTVLDVGVGFGKDGFLLREYFDVKEYNAYTPKDWKLKITGVEIFEDYLSDLQRLLYNNIVVGDIFDVLPNLGIFDLAVMADFIEHFTKEQGYSLLNQLFEHTSDIVITTPHGFSEHHFRDNKHEEHLSGWNIDDFNKYRIIDKAIVKRIRKSEELLIVYLKK